MTTGEKARTGRVVGGAYRIGGLLGRGGMGEVYAAEGKRGEAVAVKFMHSTWPDTPDMVVRFRREARIAAKIASPFVARVLGAGRDRTGELWIAFERLYGESLDARLRRETTLPFAVVHAVGGHVLQGLAAAHAVGAVHRDVKPANVFLERAAEGGEVRAKLVDFGVSKLRGATVETAHAGLTQDDDTLGTPSYMAPEQLADPTRVDGRADLYALGVVVFQALAGRVPFAGNGASAVLHHKRTRQAFALSEVTGTAWPVEVEGWLARMLAREPGGRFPDAGVALGEWETLLR